MFSNVRKKDIILSFISGTAIGLFFLLIAANIPGLAFVVSYKVYAVLAFTALAILGFLFVSLLTNLTRVGFFLQFGKFGMVGVLNTAVDFGILNFLIRATGITAGVGIAGLNIISFSAAITNSFFWNRLWVFEDREDQGSIGEFLQFVLISVVAVGINTAIVYTVANFIRPPFGLDQVTWINLGKVAATGVSMVWNFVGYKFFVFKK